MASTAPTAATSMFKSAQQSIGLNPLSLPQYKLKHLNPEKLGENYKYAEGYVDFLQSDLQDDKEGKYYGYHRAVALKYKNLYTVFGRNSVDQFILLSLYKLYRDAGMLRVIGNLDAGIRDRTTPCGKAILNAVQYCQGDYKCAIYNILASPEVAGSLYQVIERYAGGGQPESRAMAEEHLLRAHMKGIGPDTNQCIDILNNALGVPKQYWTQLMWVFYHFAMTVNQVARHYHSDVPRLATPLELSMMRGSLSAKGKHCLEENPNKACGEPRWRADCFVASTEMEGTDGCTYIVQSDGTWLRRVNESAQGATDRIPDMNKRRRRRFADARMLYGRGNHWMDATDRAVQGEKAEPWGPIAESLVGQLRASPARGETGAGGVDEHKHDRGTEDRDDDEVPSSTLSGGGGGGDSTQYY